MNSERLLKLAQHLRLINEKHFNLDYITFSPGDSSDECITNLNKIGKSHKYLGCGTVACAVGFCPSIFKESRWVKTPYGNVGVVFAGIIGDGLEAAREFFELTDDQNDYLFLPDFYPEGVRSAKDVAARIEYCVRFGFPSKEQIKDEYYKERC